MFSLRVHLRCHLEFFLSIFENIFFTIICDGVTFKIQLIVWGSGMLLGAISTFILTFVVLIAICIVAAVLFWPLHRLQICISQCFSWKEFVLFIITETESWKVLNKDPPQVVLLAPLSITGAFHDSPSRERNVDGWFRRESRILCQLGCWYNKR